MLSPEANMLLTLADEVRDKTIKLLAATPDQWLLWSPPGTVNHILWHAGHCLWLGDVLCIRPILGVIGTGQPGGSSELPEGWERLFSARGQSPAETRSWPDPRTLLQQLTDQHARLRELIGQLSADHLQHVVSPSSGSRLGRYIVHGFHDEANHQGEMYLLLKLCRAQAR